MKYQHHMFQEKIILLDWEYFSCKNKWCCGFDSAMPFIFSGTNCWNPRHWSSITIGSDSLLGCIQYFNSIANTQDRLYAVIETP
jgi:hypothetical protein